MSNMSIEKGKAQAVIWRCLASAAARAAVTAAALGLIFTYLFGIVTLETNDMFPQIQAGDVVVFIRPVSIGRQDAVVYDSPDGITAGRIAACADDTVDVTDSGQILINGNIQPVQERLGIFGETEEKGNKVIYPAVPGEDEFFILGDDRSEARDSRVYGCVRRDDIRGVIFLLIRRRAV